MYWHADRCLFMEMSMLPVSGGTDWSQTWLTVLQSQPGCKVYCQSQCKTATALYYEQGTGSGNFQGKNNSRKQNFRGVKFSRFAKFYNGWRLQYGRTPGAFLSFSLLVYYQVSGRARYRCCINVVVVVDRTFTSGCERMLIRPLWAPRTEVLLPGTLATKPNEPNPSGLLDRTRRVQKVLERMSLLLSARRKNC